MKKLLLAFCLFLGIGSLCSCSSDDEEENSGFVVWDIAPINFSIIPVDQNGNNIMHAFDGIKITAEWRGVIYEKDSSQLITRVLPPIFNGLRSTDSCLVFGELARTQTFENEQIIINWGKDEKADTIIFSNKLNWVNGDKGYKVPDIIYDVKLNGMSVDYNMKVVKKKPNRLL